nr:tryptophan-rich sensory protein [Pleurocapsa sp. PCC 7319]
MTLTSILSAFGMNILANVNPLNGLTIGEISNQFFSNILITPANYAFAIWGVIYLGLISFAIYQALPSQRLNPVLRQIGYKLAIASIAQIIWVFCFLDRLYGWSFLAMLAILLPLIGAYLCLPFNTTISRWQKWLIRTPISIYLAWISVATIVNGATVLESWQWNYWGLSGEFWTIIMLLLAALITHFVSIPRLDFAYASVFMWALIAISLRNIDNIMVSGIATGLSISLIIVLLSFSLYAPAHRNIENS